MMSTRAIQSPCAAFDAFVRERLQEALSKGQGEVPAAMSDVPVPGLVRTRNDPYSFAGRKDYFVPKPAEEVFGFQYHVAFENTAAAATPASVKPAAAEEGVVTLAVGCTYFFVDEAELKKVLELATGGRVLGLRPQLRRRTQRTGLWFLDVAAYEVPRFIAMNKCMLMHRAGTFLYAHGSEPHLRAWTDARDAALARVEGTDGQCKGLKPVTISASTGFENAVAELMAPYSWYAPEAPKKQRV